MKSGCTLVESLCQSEICLSINYTVITPNFEPLLHTLSFLALLNVIFCNIVNTSTQSYLNQKSMKEPRCLLTHKCTFKIQNILKKSKNRPVWNTSSTARPAGWVLSGYSRFLQPPQNMNVRLIGESKIVCSCELAWLLVHTCCPCEGLATCQDVTDESWDRLQHSRELLGKIDSLTHWLQCISATRWWQPNFVSLFLIYLWSSKYRCVCVTTAVIPDGLMSHLCSSPWIKAEGLDFADISSVSFQMY